MSALTLNGTAISIGREGFEEEEPLQVGDSYEAFNGSDRSSITARKRRFRCTTRALTAAELAALRALLNAAPPLPVSGNLVDGATVQCRGIYQGATAVKAQGGPRWVASFRLVER